MRILITNDDGIDAPGLAVLARIAEDIAGPDGEVWTVAPAFEQSGVGHCINYVKPTMITLEDDQLAVTTFDLPRRRKIRALRLRIVSRLPGRRAFQAGFSEIAVMR